MTPLFAAVLAYLVAQFAIGLWVSRRVRTEDDYLVAGRRLGYPLATFSIFATWFGAETCVGAAGQVHREGITIASAEPFGYGLCLFLMGLVFAAPLWRHRLTTLADLFRRRYSVPVERLAAALLIPGSILWAAAQIRAFGLVLSTTTALESHLAVTLAAGFCIAYTAFGGLLADAVTDLVQGILLVISLLVLLVAAVDHLGGVGAAWHAVATSGRFVAPAADGRTVLGALEAWAIPVAGSVLATELVSRVIASQSPRVARNASLLGGTMYVSVGLIPVFLGLTAAGILGPLDDSEQLLPALAHRLLPTLGYALFAGGLISAILSTVDSTLLVSSGLLSHNLIAPLLGGVSDRTRVRLARGGVVAFGVIAYALALGSEGVYALVEQASAFGGAGSLVTICFGLFTRLGGPRTAFATLAAGMISYLAARAGGLPYPFLASIGTSLAVYGIGAALEPGRRMQALPGV